MAIEGFVFLVAGIVLCVMGWAQYKYPKLYLKFMGARLLIFFKEETRIRILRIVGRGAMVLGVIFIIAGVYGIFL